MDDVLGRVDQFIDGAEMTRKWKWLGPAWASTSFVWPIGESWSTGTSRAAAGLRWVAGFRVPIIALL